MARGARAPRAPRLGIEPWLEIEPWPEIEPRARDRPTTTPKGGRGGPRGTRATRTVVAPMAWWRVARVGREARWWGGLEKRVPSHPLEIRTTN